MKQVFGEDNESMYDEEDEPSIAELSSMGEPLPAKGAKVNMRRVKGILKKRKGPYNADDSDGNDIEDPDYKSHATLSGSDSSNQRKSKRLRNR